MSVLLTLGLQRWPQDQAESYLPLKILLEQIPRAPPASLLALSPT